MPWKLSNIFQSFSVQGCIIDQIVSNEQQILLYDKYKIKIFQLQDGLQLLDTIEFHTEIKQICVFQGKQVQLFILAENGELSTIQPTFPYNHRVLPFPFKEGIMQSTSNRLNILILRKSEMLIYQMNQKQEIAYQLIDFRQVDLYKISKLDIIQEVVQVETSSDGGVVVLQQSYNKIDDTFSHIIASLENFKIGQAVIKSTISYVKLSQLISTKQFQKTVELNLFVLQILALEQEQILILTSRDLQLLKSDGQSQYFQFQQELPSWTFMRYIQQTNQLLICHQPHITIIELEVDNFFGQIIGMRYLSFINCSPGITDLVVSSIKQQIYIWFQNENGSFLSQLQEKQKQLQIPQEIEPQARKLVKLDGPEQQFQQIQSFPLYNRIFNIRVFQNQLYLLYGNEQVQQICRVQHEIHLLKNQQTIALQNQLQAPVLTFGEGYFGQVQDGILKLTRIQSDFTIQQLDMYSFQNDQPILLKGLISKNQVLIITQTTFFLININASGMIQYPFNLYRPKYIMQFVVGFDIDNKLNLYLAQKDPQQFKLQDLTNESIIDSIDAFDISMINSILHIIIVGNNKIQLFSFDNSKLTLVFQTTNIDASPCYLGDKQINNNFIAHTCPSIVLQLGSQLQITNTSEQIIDVALINFHGSNQLAFILLFSNLNASIYQTPNYKDKLDYLKLLMRVKLTQRIPQLLDKYLLQFYQMYIPSFDLVLTDQQGELFIHFVKSEQNPIQQILGVQRGQQRFNFLFDTNQQIYLFPQLGYLTANRIISTNVLQEETKGKSTILINEFQFLNQDYLLVINKIQSSRQYFKNELLIFNSQLQKVSEFSDFDNEEVIKVCFMPVYEIIVVLTATFQIQTNLSSELTRIHILKFDQFHKLEQIEYKSIKDQVPVDLTILNIYHRILVATQDQLKFFDPPSRGRNSNLISLSLQSNENQKFVITQYECLISMDRMIAVLNGGFQVIVCKMAEDVSQPKADQSIEFGVCGGKKILDLQLFKVLGMSQISILDNDFSLHIYSLNMEKNKLKKVAMLYIPDPCKINVIGEQLLISTIYGQLFMLEHKEEITEDQYLEDLPYIGGFSIRRGWNVYAQNDIFDNLSLPLQRAIQKQQ